MAGIVAIALLFALNLPVAAQESDLVTRFKELTKATEWRLVETVEMRFPTHHPQGMVVVGDQMFFSAVEVIVATEQYGRILDGYDRTSGEGIGHLFKVDRQGNLIAHTTVGVGTIYHPGGIDYDGRYLWVPVAEYRPNSQSIIYRVDPSTMEAVEVFRFKDHIGGLVHDTGAGTLHGISWGSRYFYKWELNASLEPVAAALHPANSRTPNGNHYIDYQDCHYQRDRYMLCAGVSVYPIPILRKYALGGIDLVDLRSQQAVHQIPVPRWVKPDLVMSSNPFFAELVGDHVRFYFMPEDDESTIYVYQTSGK